MQMPDSSWNARPFHLKLCQHSNFYLSKGANTQASSTWILIFTEAAASVVSMVAMPLPGGTFIVSIAQIDYVQGSL